MNITLKTIEPSNNKGFTLIETLVAITILMIAIAGPLTVANKAYTSALDARNMTIAYNLAQESLEYLNVIKDNQASFSAPTDLTVCTSANPCGISGVQSESPFDNTSNTIKPCILSYPCKITSSATDGYTYRTFSSEGVTHEATTFVRKGYLEQAGTNDQYIATVTVTWSTGSLNNQVTLKQLLTSAKRGI